MKTGHLSRTAEYMAFFRALETEAPLSERLFENGFASYFLSPALRRICFLAKVPLANKILQKFIDFMFIWEGVTNYLTESAVDLTLNWCKQAAAGSKLVFTYVHKRVLDTPEEFYGTRKIIAALRDAGEQWTFGLDPSSLAEFLSERGLRLDVDLDANDYRQICYGRAASHMRGYEFYRLAICSIGE